MKSNVNSKDYWDRRFGTGDWERKGGYSQSKHFAEAQIPLLGISSEFEGTLCDFGCGSGDAFPVYRDAFPRAKLIGVDFSQEAIRLCIERYGDQGEFYCATAEHVPNSDVIICSNVMEHINNDDVEVMMHLLKHCVKLYVIVPYKEQPLSLEHLRQYDENSFDRFSPVRQVVYLSKGWSKYGKDLWVGVYLKNIARALLGRALQRQQRQILFEFHGTEFLSNQTGPALSCITGGSPSIDI